ncbi:hypothetical protein [Desertivirga arenae]|uniref:hypothetical protein n=1 Tax=Desertivirga arenae TaxID=2810309 RepID=UPI001A964CF9|nr:hypothetical protein [Pedobacter sp. SYSU D00823]
MHTLNRLLLLKSVLRDNFTEQFINRYEAFVLTGEEAQAILNKSQVVLETFPSITDAAILSSIFAGELYETFPVAVIAGTLKYKGVELFSITQAFPTSGKTVSVQVRQKAHFWIEFGGYIIDISFFKRLYSGEVRAPFQHAIIGDFGASRGAIISKADLVNKYGFDYEPQFSLSQYQISRLLEEAKGVATTVPIPGVST